MMSLARREVSALMARSKITISPTTRSLGPTNLEVWVEQGRVVDARCATGVFRGFELILKDRDPLDAPYITQRICGICPAAHSTAASLALENLTGVRPPWNGNVLRNLLLAGNTLQNHLRHFYFHVIPDYVPGPEKPPFVPRPTKDYRMDKAANKRLLNHYFDAFTYSRMAYELDALLGGKGPHPHSILPGGSTVPPTAPVLMDIQARLNRIKRFIDESMVPDVHTLAQFYPEYYQIGSRSVRLLAFSMFPKTPEDREDRYFPAGVVLDGKTLPPDPKKIREHFRFAYFKDPGKPEHPTAASTKPRPNKEGAYSWSKAPRYDGMGLEGGSLARLWVTGDYRKGVSVMDRLVARVMDTRIIAGMMIEWLDQLKLGEPIFNHFEVPSEGEGLGLTGAMRGPLGHWIKVEGGRIASYQIITPSAWNFSPRDDRGNPGPFEEALIGTPIEDELLPVEIGRVMRSFDPCMACVTHVYTPSRLVQRFVI